MRNALTSRIGKYTVAWLAAAAITLAALAPSMPAKAASNEETAFFYLTDTLGFNVAAACGIMANPISIPAREAGAAHTASASGWEAAWTVLIITAGITDSIPNLWQGSFPT